MSQPISFKELNNELETILEKLQSSELDVDQILVEYQKGIEIVEQLEKYLETARNKITKINKKSPKAKK